MIRKRIRHVWNAESERVVVVVVEYVIMKRSPFIHGNINVGIYTYCKFHCYCISMHRFTQMAYGWRKDI
mgnify:CR=1 FL=1